MLNHTPHEVSILQFQLQQGSTFSTKHKSEIFRWLSIYVSIQLQHSCYINHVTSLTLSYWLHSRQDLFWFKTRLYFKVQIHSEKKDLKPAMVGLETKFKFLPFLNRWQPVDDDQSRVDDFSDLKQDHSVLLTHLKPLANMQWSGKYSILVCICSNDDRYWKGIEVTWLHVSPVDVHVRWFTTSLNLSQASSVTAQKGLFILHINSRNQVSKIDIRSHTSDSQSDLSCSRPRFW